MAASLKQLRNQLAALADKERAANLQHFFKTGPGQYGEGDRFMGIRVPQLRALVREFGQLPEADVHSLLQSKIHEQRLLALLILVRRFEHAEPRQQKSIYDYYLANTCHINNWDLVDLSAPNILGAYLWQRDKRPLYRLARSASLWERRMAVLATFYFIKNNLFDDALAIAELLLQDQHDLIHKAVGWMLREIGKRDLKREQAFLDSHYRNMPRTMLRYAIEKFPETRRQRYLKGIQ